MSDFVHVTADQVVALNAEHCGGGTAVLNRGGIEAQLGRARGGAFGQDPYPTVWEKAAVILHGLSTTQYFSDGNKRTAWLTAALFLGVNGHPLRDMPDIQAEAFVMAIATKIFETDEDRERSITKAADWFRSAAFSASDRLAWVEIAMEAETPFGNGILNARQLGSTEIEIRDPRMFPPGSSAAYCVLVANWVFHPWDMGRVFDVDVELRGTGSFGNAPYEFAGPAVPYRLEAGQFLRGDGSGKPTGIRFLTDLYLTIHRHAPGLLVIRLDGEEAGRLQLNVVDLIQPPSDDDIAGLLS